MKIIWTLGAANDLTEAGRRVAKVIYDQTMSLASMPYRGRKRISDSARELVFAPWPYVAVYEIIEEKIYIEGIRHTSRETSEHY
jgi:plasmid stabilization system protein ParE